MRAVQVPSDEPLRCLVIEERQGAWDRFQEWTEAEGRPAIEVFMGRLVTVLRNAQSAEFSQGDAQGWGVMRVGTSIREESSGDVVLTVAVACSDDASGGRLHGCVADELTRSEVSFVLDPDPGGMYQKTVPVHARVLEWRFGHRPGAIEADMVPTPGIREPKIVRHPAHPVLACPECGERCRPVDRINGYPSHEGALAVELGEAVYGTCCHDGPLAPAECGGCGAGLVPGTVAGAAAAEVVLGLQAHLQLERGYRRVWASGPEGPAVWTPRATLRDGTWVFRLPRAVRKLMRSRWGSWAVLRPACLPCLLLPWDRVTGVLVGNAAARVQLEIDGTRPTVVRIAGHDVEAIVDPGEMPRDSDAHVFSTKYA